jgi:nucleotide-binding universal stress UspA family protein
MYERVLLPLDGSELSEGVIPYAKQIAQAAHTTATVMHVLAMTQPEAERATVTPESLPEPRCPCWSI